MPALTRLKALQIMKDLDVPLELTNLLIPTLNDSEQEIKDMCCWIVENLGTETPLHFSRFFPQNQLMQLPPTPTETIRNAKDIATQTGLKFVYVGNMNDREGESTWCPDCGEQLIERTGYQIRSNRIKDGKCPKCDFPIYGIWE